MVYFTGFRGKHMKIDADFYLKAALSVNEADQLVDSRVRRRRMLCALSFVVVAIKCS